MDVQAATIIGLWVHAGLVMNSNTSSADHRLISFLLALCVNASIIMVLR